MEGAQEASWSDVRTNWLLSKWRSSGSNSNSLWAPYPFCKVEPSHLTEEIHFLRDLIRTPWKHILCPTTINMAYSSNVKNLGVIFDQDISLGFKLPFLIKLIVRTCSGEPLTIA